MPRRTPGLALREYDVEALGTACAPRKAGRCRAWCGEASPGRPARGANDSIRIVNAREHNLKSLDVDIPRGQAST